jgi:protein-S-isoprenylcysteine O-methyltransferase Ste14
MPNKPNIAIKPPKVLLTSLALAMVFHLWREIDIFSEVQVAQAVGWVLLALSVLLMLWAVKTMNKHKVDFRFAPVPRVVSKGPYKFTRNPMYVAMTLLVISIGFILNGAWFLIMAGLFVVFIQINVVHVEEKYLEKELGEEYKKYKARVRAWL